MREAEADAQGGERERILQGGDAGRGGAEQAVAPASAAISPARPRSRCRAPARGGTGLGREGVEGVAHRPAPGAGAEPARHAPVAGAERTGVLVAEQVGDVGAQARPPGGLGEGPAAWRR